jgi:hypothetical protein
MTGILAAFGLTAATGLNAYLPLLIVGLLARYTHLIALKPPWSALTNPVVSLAEDTVSGVTTVVAVAAPLLIGLLLLLATWLFIRWSNRRRDRSSGGADRKSVPSGTGRPSRRSGIRSSGRALGAYFLMRL